MFKIFYYYQRKYKLYEDGTIIRCEYFDTRIQQYNDICNHLKRFNKARLLKPFIDKDGYSSITLYCNPHHRTYRLHHLVYLVFCLNIIQINDCDLDYSNNLQINHIDGDKSNNNYTNLEVVSLQDNIKHACKNKLHNSQIKAKYVEVYFNEKYITTLWKLKNVCKYLFDNYNIKTNTGTISNHVKSEKPYYNFTFKYIECNDYPEKEYSSSELEVESIYNIDKDIV